MPEVINARFQGNACTKPLRSLRRVRSTTLADNATTTASTSQVWNALDQLTQATDPKLVATTYTYNAFGEVLTETSPDSGTQTYVRDAAGNVTASTDARGQVTQYTRDALGRPTLITLADGKTQSFTYDSVGNVSQMTDPSGSTSYTRDALSRILQKTQTVADNPANPSSYAVQYVYQSGGAVAQINYPSGLKVFYRRNAAGQIIGVDTQKPGSTTVAPFVTGITYTALQQPKAWTWFNADSASRSFDADGRMSTNEFASYSFDAASRITGVTQQVWALQFTSVVIIGAPPGPTYELARTPIPWSAQYDSRDRLINFARPGSASTYTYDANSNRLTSINTADSNLDLEGLFTLPLAKQTVNQTLSLPATSNRLLGFTQTLTKYAGVTPSTTTSTVNYSLDAAGNLTSDGLRSFTYDAQNRQAKVQLTQSPEAAKITYLHNALGQRVFKSEPQVAQTAPNATTLGTPFVNWLQSNFGWLFAQAQANATLGQSYVYDDGQLGSTPMLLGEYGNGGTQSTGRFEYIWLPQEDGSTMPIGLYTNSRLYAIHADHLNTPRLITDDTNATVWQLPYSAFGDNKPTGVLALAGAFRQRGTVPGVTFNLRFPGQYFDEESNLSYNGFRSYQPSQGRYPQSDPIGLAGGLNRFGYVGGNPLSKTDPQGLATIPVPGFTVPALTSACLANPAVCGPVLAGAGGYAVGTLINPLVQPVLARVIDACTANSSDEDRCQIRKNYCITFCQYELDFPGRRDNTGPFRACIRRCMNAVGCSY